MKRFEQSTRWRSGNWSGFVKVGLPRVIGLRSLFGHVRLNYSRSIGQRRSLLGSPGVDGFRFRLRRSWSLPLSLFLQ